MSAISVSSVSKHFSFKTHKGLKGFLSPAKKQVVAVDDISFTVERGEAVAFIGPNGAGKSTTIKMLSGILSPTSGEVRVLGLEPLTQRRQLAMKIGTVFGQRSQLVFNLPLLDSFALTAAMYQVPEADAQQRINTLIKQFDLHEFIDQPVRKLSLGQRMRAEVANALIHNPEIIFLDEPTIGLDIVAKRALREVIKNVNRERGTTVFLTSHDVGDIEEVCDRTMIVNHGKIMLDAKTADLKTDYLRTKTVSIVPEGKLPTSCTVAGHKAEVREGRLVFDVDTSVMPLKTFIAALLDDLEISDITIEDTPLEDVIHELYTKDKADAKG
ncbi:MAG TPA: ATP-binding cassette domain-containing protein [Candidatus Saccharimonadales bacterium]|nr:ATP-binding cassette domain-containing protein [Candidatus Saccharimonadales bacterium]